ncbi:MAG: hypothetical protein K9N47_15210 [Prosthecobacter sp.]|uniref:hypothetical protein n=1 Tax=Prosthecobacter sp. TaxID=1965333 RepID=UPI0025F546F1|nr:hypothetical protein [Prosthecobacter sp.]MCF7787477.1 hypothetical protein [Prosthecobacter sp.]
MNSPELEAFINGFRGCGTTTLRIFNDSTPQNLDIVQQCRLLVEKSGFENCEGLCEIDRSKAERILVSFMLHEMAYGVRCIPINKAPELAQQFLGVFPTEETRFFTNSDFEESVEIYGGHPLLNLSSWNSITHSTFETGVIALSPATQGIFWFEDED